MADNTTNINNSTNSLNKSSNEVQSSIDKLSTNMKRLVAIQMTQLVKESSEYADNIESAYGSYKKIIDLENKHIIKLREENRIEQEKLKIEEKLAKLEKQAAASDKAKEEFEKRVQELKNKRLDTEEKLLSEINKLRKEGFDIDENEIDSQEELISYLERRKNIFKRNVEISKLQSIELRKQVEFYKKHGVLVGLLNKKWNDIKKAITFDNILNKSISLTKGWLSQLASFASFGKVFDRVKTAASSYQDNMWGLGQSLKYTNDGLLRTTSLLKDYDDAIRNARITAAKFGTDTDRVLDSMNQLSSKVLFLKKVSETIDGKKVFVNRYDYGKVSDITQGMIAFSRAMRMDVSEAIDMYSEAMRKFGMSSTQAMGMMSEMQAQTITFNDILGENAVFADEVGRAMLEIQQGTRYWVQDLMMLNTQFNSHINLLIKQGKSQKEALALAKSFQRIMTEPTTALTKYNVGKSIKEDYHKAIDEAEKKGLSEEEQVLAGAKSLGMTKKVYYDKGKKLSKEEAEYLKSLGYSVTEKDEYISESAKSKAETIYGATIRDKKFATEKGESDFFAEEASQTSRGVTGNINYWLDRFNKSGWRLEVAQSQGFGENLSEAAELERMLREVKARGWDKEEGLSWEKVISRIATEDFDKEYGGLENGKASSKLLDSFDKLTEEEKKRYAGNTKEEKARKYREEQIKKSIEDKNKSKEDNRQFDMLGKINDSNKDIKGSITSEVGKVIQKLTKIEILLGIGLGAQVGNVILSGAQLYKGFRKTKTAIDAVTTTKNITKITPKTKTAIPNPPSTGSVGNATKKMSFNEWKKGYSGTANRAEQRKLWKEAKGVKKGISSAVKKGATSSVSGIVAKNAARMGGKKIPGAGAAMGLAFGADRLASGDKIGAVGEVLSGAASTIPMVGTAISTALDVGLMAKDVISSLMSNSKNQEELFKEFSQVAPDMAMLPENIDTAINEYLNNSEGLSQDEISDLKKSLRASYDNAYKESSKSNTKDENALALQKKLDNAKKSQEDLIKQNQLEEKIAYSQLDDLGKLVVNQEKMFDMHKRWFSFQVENEARRILTDNSLDKNQKMSLVRGMSRGAAGFGMVKQSIDASGVTTWKVTGNDVVGAVNATGLL